MEAQGVIRKITEPTDWVSSMTISKKANGRLRICLDPKELNQAIKRCHHKSPTVEEITHQLHGAQYFSKMDAKNGYWSIRLDKESQLLTCFNSPFGRYVYERMAFGLVMSQDVFKHRMDQFLERCPGTIGIADDIIVFGKTEEEHDKNLHHLMQEAASYGLMFNSDKCAIKTDQIIFFGMVYDKHGVHPDPGKVESIKSMEPPTNKTEVQEFIGMVNYLAPFIPSLSDQTADLRNLLKNDVPFVWNESYQKSFQNVKDQICTSATLQYFDTNKETVIQVDASLRGLGVVLLQEGKPIAFASKALHDAETRYANIERELLAVVFGCERFHTFVYGKQFVVESDHKPLEMIQHKPLTAAPPRLQRMLLRLQPYDMTIKYRPGKEITLADGLSRLPPKDAMYIDLDVQVNFVAFSTNHLEQVREESAQDDDLQQLTEIITTGWPQRMKDLPERLRNYWSFRDEMSVDNGLVLKGTRIVIPGSMRQPILSKLHEGHQGSNKTKLRAKDTVYWHNINADIEKVCATCPTCQTHQPAQSTEPLMNQEIPSRPWQILGSDLFSFEGDNYLIVADYYSKFPIVRKMPARCTSHSVIQACKQIFGEYGTPEKMITDNGPQYSSETFKEFTQAWQLQHTTSSPHYPQSNGFAELQVKIVKKAFQKAKDSGHDPQAALLCIRTTPIDSKLPSPSELLYGRRIQGNIPTILLNNHEDKESVHNNLQRRQEKQKRYHDQHAKELPPLSRGQEVSVQDSTTAKWVPATILAESTEPRSYILETKGGAVLRRNRRHIRMRDQEQINDAFQRKDSASKHAKKVRFDLSKNAYYDSAPHSGCPGKSGIPPKPNQITTSGRLVKKPNKLDL